MELRHLIVGLGDLSRVGEVAAGTSPLVISCRDGDTVVALASLAGALSDPVGLWLAIDDDYPAALAARDVATLSWLVDLEHVVLAGDNAFDSAEVVRALLSDDEVTLTNSAASLRGAYNRPAPPRAVVVWALDGEELRGEERTLRGVARIDSPLGALAVYAD